MSTVSRIAILITAALLSGPLLAKGKSGRSKVNVHPNQTNDGTWTFSAEINPYQQSAYLDTGLTYSSLDDWDIALATQNIPLSGQGDPGYQDDTYLQISKTLVWSGAVSTILATQSGYALYSAASGIPGGLGKLHHLDFINNKFRISDNLQLHGGSYYVNAALSTRNAYFGGLIGFEWSLNDLVLRADYLGGHTNVSGATVSVNYYRWQNLNTYLGIGIPEQHTGNEFYGLIGFQLSTGSLR